MYLRVFKGPSRMKTTCDEARYRYLSQAIAMDGWEAGAWLDELDHRNLQED